MVTTTDAESLFVKDVCGTGIFFWCSIDNYLWDLREIVRSGVNGYLVSPGEVGGLARRISELPAHPEELERMSHQARRG